MKRILTWLAATAAGVVLLFGYRTSTQVVMPSAEPAPAGTEAASTPATQSGSTQSGSTQSGSTGGAAGGLQDGTYTGAAADTRFGPVQVRITVQGGAVTAATAVAYPTESRRDQQINASAIPVLEQESVGVQDAQQVDMVTGATYTSEGYVGSLQAALDEARP
ncbi:FMN-binding protein [Xylanimonas protaetiae]|uniref:FMN-binding protein n=1 Tax=Xylanimonas protaetiae TaxID=2509457 RepID=A0A4P6F6I6_9MICO|nr:FMN-binding protein [Xylanimonas protaetiae]QAY71372.1 FMN-binding protein [Xylanimonas protaetiae]